MLVYCVLIKTIHFSTNQVPYYRVDFESSFILTFVPASARVVTGRAPPGNARVSARRGATPTW